MTVTGKNLALAEKIQGLIEEKRDKAGAGAGFAFIRGGELVSACAAGFREGEDPIQVGDLFNIGSVSKVYCAMALLKLAEQGKLKLDDPVCSYLPQFEMRDPRFRDITLRMCINHTSGLPGTMLNDSFATQWMGEKEFHSLLYRYFAKSKLKSVPGAVCTYCNDGFSLAEMVVSEVSGMSYTSFVQQYITRPIGALSTCSAENNPENRFRVHSANKPVEALNVVGAGGISTDLIDCARFGYMFLKPDGVFSAQSVAEVTTPQNKSWPGGDAYNNLGLGWDSVAYASPAFDFGSGTLMKSGGTLQFTTYLLVSKKYDFAAAMSATNDCKIDVLSVLCEMCAVAMDEYGVDVKLEVEKPEPQKLPRPEDWQARYAGVYANSIGIFKAEAAGDDGVSLKRCKDGEWVDFADAAAWDGVAFVHAAMTFKFVSKDGHDFIYQKSPLGFVAIAQKPKNLPPLDPKWQARVGKKYILTEGNATDMIIGGVLGGGLIISNEGDMLLFHLPAQEMGPITAPAASAGPDDTNMFINVSGGSRDMYNFFAYQKDGVEYIEGLGFVFVEESALKAYDPLTDAGKYGAFKLTRDIEPGSLLQHGLRAVITNSALLPLYDGLAGSKLPGSTDGYVLFLK